MAYSDSIEALKSALNGYSENELKISELYKTAIENAEAEFQSSLKALEKDYRNARKEAYSDTAREERNLMTVLANRGLGASGEAVQAKLNSGIILGNRLGDLADLRNENRLKLEQDHADNKLKLSMEESDKLNDMLKHKDGINVDIASLELKKEQGDADREAQAKYNADKLASEQAMHQADLQAEKEALDAKLKAEKEMQEAELYAKYYAVANGGSSSKEEDTQTDGYVPSATAKELAKQLITSATGGNSINSEKDEYKINKYLLTLFDYNIDSKYMNDLMFLLKGYGYEALSESQMREKVITYEAKTYYSEYYDSYYDKYILDGYDENEARSKAKDDALNMQLDYIYKSCGKDLALFTHYCSLLEVDNDKVTEFINNIQIPVNTNSNNTGWANSYPTRVEK